MQTFSLTLQRQTTSHASSSHWIAQKIKPQRKLLTLKGGKLQLEMSINRLLQSAQDVSYVFKLKPVAVEQIDILESKLKDQYLTVVED
ncbi:hypothetical protein PF002_g20759 [Phytophthora fragariae]|uniref:Uncharacterized protein n=1 Tax=Phytophthora fragariae TaxID=53985 RepID=A0A6A3XVG4_9STRA|nr:hypothetical protein PF009_g25939 [Phytophthora fragariae]KAE9204023.1 hypothetical protein PF002_g20759 [Phytophthora fragariae]KAE9275858.1 hypothetical protein PF001_g26396 [Phytophthora fragariae]